MWLSGKEPACQNRKHRWCQFDPGSGRSPEVGNGNPFQYSCLDNSVERGAWWVTVHGIAKCQTTKHGMATESTFDFVDFIIISSCFHSIDFCSNFYCFLLLLLGLHSFFVSSFIRWTLLLLFSCSVQFSCSSHVWLFATPWTAACQASLAITNSRSLLKLMTSCQWCHPTISSFIIPFFSNLQSFLASGSFPMNWFFVSGGQSIRISASTSVLPMNVQDWFPLRLIGWISLQSKGLSRVFSSITVQKHQFFGTQLSLESNSHLVLLHVLS